MTDIALYHNQRPRLGQEAVLATASHRSGRRLERSEAEVQDFLIRMFTTAGSNRLWPSKGSDFFESLVSRRLRSAQDILSGFVLAAHQVLAGMADSRIERVELEQVIVEESRVVLHVRFFFPEEDLRVTIPLGEE